MEEVESIFKTVGKQEPTEEDFKARLRAATSLKDKFQVMSDREDWVRSKQDKAHQDWFAKEEKKVQDILSSKEPRNKFQWEELQKANAYTCSDKRILNRMKEDKTNLKLLWYVKGG